MLLIVESLALAAVVYVTWLFAGVFGIAFLGLFGGGSVWYVLRQRRRMRASRAQTADDQSRRRD